MSEPDRAGTRIVIVGGGLAGLAAAEALARSSREPLDVTILESKRVPGGRAGSFADGATGESVDYCQHAAMGCCTNLIAMIRRCGLSDSVRRYKELAFLHPDFPPSRFAPWPMLPAPLHLAPTIGQLRYLSGKQKWAIRWAIWRLMRTPTSKLTEQTAGSWLRSQGQDAGAIANYWDVILVSALGEETDRVSMAAARKVIIDGFAAAPGASDLLVPALPLSQLFGRDLVDAITDLGVKVRSGTPVESIRWNEKRQSVAIQTDAPEAIPADHVILAVPWYRLGGLLDDSLAREAIENFDRLVDIPTSPISGIHLWFDRPITDRPHAVMVGTTAQWLFRQPLANAPGHQVKDDDQHYYQVVISASRKTRMLGQDESLNQVLDELAHAFPAAKDARLIRSRVVTDPRSVFSLTPETDSIRPPARTALPWLHLAGDWIATGWPATMEGAVIGGRMAAANVQNQLGWTQTTIDGGLTRGPLARLLIKD